MESVKDLTIAECFIYLLELPLKEAASLLWYFHHDPLRSLTLLSLNVSRWSETKNLKISNSDNIFFLYLIMIKLCTFKELENIHQKLNFHNGRGFHGSHLTKMTKKGLEASFTESLMNEYK